MKQFLHNRLIKAMGLMALCIAFCSFTTTSAGEADEIYFEVGWSDDMLDTNIPITWSYPIEDYYCSATWLSLDRSGDSGTLRFRLEPNTSSTMVRSANVTVTVYNNFTEDGTATPAVHKHTYHLVITQDKCPDA